MNEQLQPLKKQPRAGKAGRSGTQDDIVYAHIFEAILEQRLAPGTKLSEEALGEIFRGQPHHHSPRAVASGS